MLHNAISGKVCKQARSVNVVVRHDNYIWYSDSTIHFNGKNVYQKSADEIIDLPENSRVCFKCLKKIYPQYDPREVWNALKVYENVRKSIRSFDKYLKMVL
jgi:hypothetical protein